jgi:hypothetical protein
MSCKIILCTEECEKCSLASCNFHPEFLDILKETKSGALSKPADETFVLTEKEEYPDND